MLSATPPAASTDAGRAAAPVRHFGRFQLLRLLGKSERTMAWLVADPRHGQELMLVLPRAARPSTDAAESWLQPVRKAARLSHPHLAHAVEIGFQDHWPFVAYDLGDGSTLRDRLGRHGMAAPEAAQLAVQALQGLAYAHEAGVAHRDLQPHLLIVGAQGAVRVAGLEVAGPDATPDRGAAEPGAMRAQQDASQRDVLALGVVLHHAIVGRPALDEPDVGQVIARLPPLGRELVRLPWDVPQPVPEPLRAIVNRATDRQERQRYRNARTLAGALDGWLRSDAALGGGPLALLADRLRVAGALPSQPGAADRAARLALMDRRHTAELAEIVLEDVALAFELLRAVNSAQVRGGQVSGNGAVLTVRRAIAMLGLDGVRRAALALRPWPGPLDEAGAAALEQVIARVKRAGRIAFDLRPPGYDGEVVYLIALLQNLGRLVVHYHFPDEAQQIRRLMQPAPPARAGDAEEPGMGEADAAFAVLGTDIEGLGLAVARLWGLDDDVLAMVRPLPLATLPRSADGDGDLLRAAASCGNEVLDALALPATRQALALNRVVQRYGRMLGFGARELQAAIQGQPRPISAATLPAELDEPNASSDAAPGSGRAR